jgi:5'-3' exonuclease
VILVDLSQIAVACAFASEDVKTKGLNKNIITHMILTSLLNLKIKFGKDYGDIIICCDGESTWRHDVFPYYKSSRKKDRDDSYMDWDKLYSIIDDVKEDLKDHFPYKLLELNNCEADDVIAILSQNAVEETLIVSSDHDYFQLHGYDKISQYCPRKKQMINVDDAEKALATFCVKGDRGDGIPNIRSDSDTFTIKGKRQKTISAKMLESYLEEIPEDLQENWERNRQLIDFDCIPDNVKFAILEEFIKPANGNKKTLYNYFIQNNFKELLKEVNKF